MTANDILEPMIDRAVQIAEAVNKSAGLKFDTGKPPLDLLSRIWLEGTADVLAYGAKKYAAHNWRKGIQFSRLLASVQRHILAFQDGEDLDPETGLSHLFHASCGLMFLSDLAVRKPEMDDRYNEARDKEIAKKIEESGYERP